ncbi:hypothetical protein T439DRAFT_324515 [Meredithblackwellia eburnea MCA 4105]
MGEEEQKPAANERPSDNEASNSAHKRQSSIPSEFDTFEDPDGDGDGDDPPMVDAEEQHHPLNGANGDHNTGAAINRDGAKTPTKALQDDNATLAALAASSPKPSFTPGSDDEPDPNGAPSFVLVASLRSQITDLTSQVSSLNTKLVSSYTRIGDFEDDLHERHNEIKALKSQVTELQRSKDTWEREIEAGGWVEKHHVQTEMRGLMTRVLEESKSRESAVQAHSKLETEIENLTSSLFTEANKMVAVERFARARADEKLRSVEESNGDMSRVFEEVQSSLRDTMVKLEEREKEVAALKQRLADAGIALEAGKEEEGSPKTDNTEEGASPLFSDGERVTELKGLALSTPGTPQRGLTIAFQRPRLVTSVVPYNEFVSFVTYLRQLRVQVLSRPQDYAGYPHQGSSTISTRGFGANPSQPPPPVPISIPPATLLAPHLPLSTHSSQPFVKRCVEEDSDPGLRLDYAPGLGFLSRRTVGTAILDGTLLIEPTYSGSTLPSSTCALCGCGLEKWWTGGELPTMSNAPAKVVNQTMRKVLGGSGWSIPNFSSSSRNNSKQDVSSSNSTPTTPGPTSPTGGEAPFNFSGSSQNLQIHIFRVNDTSTARYAICPVYCLPRLRAVCEFWTYIRAMERGLLLEEGFHFVGGKGVNGALAESRAGSGSNVSLPANGTGSRNASKASLVGLKSVENLAATPIRKVDIAALEQEAEDSEKKDGEEPSSPVVVVSDEKEKKEEGKVDGEKHVEASSEEKSEEEKKERDGSSSEQEDDKDVDHSSPKTADEGGNTPMLSAPSSPVTISPSQSPTLNRPPVPKRSQARTPASASVASSATATPTPATVAGGATLSPVPPKLPPRHPNHHTVLAAAQSSSMQAAHSHAGGAKATQGGAKASELGGLVDAMEIVGGATGWEDRCWAEVVRLKESIFWTRVAREQLDEI